MSTHPRVGPLVKGALSFPFARFRSTYGNPLLDSNNAEFCYSVFLRHYSYVAAGFGGMPPAVAELGPGGSVGVGLAALLAGAESYTALDSHWHMDTARTLEIFARLVELFRARAPVPAEGPHSKTFPLPLDWAFPATLQPRLDDRWLAKIENDIRQGGGCVQIAVPWETTQTVAPGSIDWLFSHSCLEHVDGIAAALQATFSWLRPGGVATHEIDHRSHNLTQNWDGHWGMHEAVWRVLRGRRHYLINRLPHSFYVDEMRRIGFEIETDIILPKVATVTALPRFQLVESDRCAAMSFVVARKPAVQPAH